MLSEGLESGTDGVEKRAWLKLCRNIAIKKLVMEISELGK